MAIFSRGMQEENALKKPTYVFLIENIMLGRAKRARKFWVFPSSEGLLGVCEGHFPPKWGATMFGGAFWGAMSGSPKWGTVWQLWAEFLMKNIEQSGESYITIYNQYHECKLNVDIYWTQEALTPHRS